MLSHSRVLVGRPVFMLENSSNNHLILSISQLLSIASLGIFPLNHGPHLGPSGPFCHPQTNPSLPFLNAAWLPVPSGLAWTPGPSTRRVFSPPPRHAWPLQGASHRAPQGTGPPSSGLLPSGLPGPPHTILRAQRPQPSQHSPSHVSEGGTPLPSSLESSHAFFFLSFASCWGSF